MQLNVMSDCWWNTHCRWPTVKPSSALKPVEEAADIGFKPWLSLNIDHWTLTSAQLECQILSIQSGIKTRMVNSFKLRAPPKATPSPKWQWTVLFLKDHSSASHRYWDTGFCPWWDFLWDWKSEVLILRGTYLLLKTAHALDGKPTAMIKLILPII